MPSDCGRSPDRAALSGMVRASALRGAQGRQLPAVAVNILQTGMFSCGGLLEPFEPFLVTAYSVVHGLFFSFWVKGVKSSATVE